MRLLHVRITHAQAHESLGRLKANLQGPASRQARKHGDQQTAGKQPQQQPQAFQKNAVERRAAQ